VSRPPSPPVVGGPVRPPSLPQRTAPVRPMPTRHVVQEPVRSAREDRRAIRTAVRRRRAAESAERRAAGVRTRRLGVLAVAGVLVLLVGLPPVLAFGPVFLVRTIAVRGVDEPVAAAVRTALQGEIGRPVALVDDAQVAKALRAVPAVERYDLVRRPPDTIELVVVPRTAVAQERTADGWAQVDASRVVIETLPQQAALPVVDVPAGADRPAGAYAAVVAALEALDGSGQAVVSAQAATPDDVVLTLGSGLRVRWGGADDGAAKAEALSAALRRAARTATEVDVSSPGVVLIR
jgi:cell division protein FtsQ